jgi:hypothetical protein
MTEPNPVKLPSRDLFYRPFTPEPLSEEGRQWLVEQLHAYPKRVNEDRTCAIGALTEMATTEFCRLMAERAALQATNGECQRLRSALEKAREAIANLPQDGLGMAQIAFGGPDDIYPIRDELLSEIDATLKEQSA